MNPNTPIIINSPSKQNDGATEYVVKAGIVVALFYFGNKAYKKWRADEESKKVGSDVNAQAAAEIHQAIDGAGTAEKVLYLVANRSFNWVDVGDAYKKLYNANMLEDLKGDLSPEEYIKFMNIYNLSKKDANGNSTGGKNTVVKGYWVYVEKSANVRKAPKIATGLIDSAKAILHDNIIGLAAAGKYLGVTTGRTAVDIGTKESTLFIELQIGIIDAKGGYELVNAWVASSQVRTEAPKKGWSPGAANLITFAKDKYTKALGSIGADSNYKSELRTKEAVTAIYDVNGKLINYANSKGLILGYKEAETNYQNKRYYIFKNIQGITRIVPVDAVKEVKL